MSERTVDEALCRASELRGLEFRYDYSHFEDQDDLVLLADEVLRLRDPSLRVCTHSPKCEHPRSFVEAVRVEQERIARQFNTIGVPPPAEGQTHWSINGKLYDLEGRPISEPPHK